LPENSRRMRTRRSSETDLFSNAFFLLFIADRRDMCVYPFDCRLAAELEHLTRKRTNNSSACESKGETLAEYDRCLDSASEMQQTLVQGSSTLLEHTKKRKRSMEANFVA